MKTKLGNYYLKIGLSLLFILFVFGGISQLYAKPPFQKDNFAETLHRMQDKPLKPNQLPEPWGVIRPDELDLTPHTPQPFEDGRRTAANDGSSFEWWYYDAVLNDGSSVVVTFFTKPFLYPTLPTDDPYVSVTLLPAPDGTGEPIEPIKKIYRGTSDNTSFSSDGCDVNIGPNYTNGNLLGYSLYVEIDDVEINLFITSTVPAWRSGASHWYFNDHSNYFAWLGAVPSGFIAGTMHYNGVTHDVLGSAYHDHNWGTIRVYDYEKYWWWSRSQVGPYTIIACDQKMKNRYGNDAWLGGFGLLSANGPLLETGNRDVDGNDDVTVSHTVSDLRTHPDPSCPDMIEYSITFRAEKTNGDWAEIRLEVNHMIASTDLMPLIGSSMTDQEKFIAEKILKQTPWYTRFVSNAVLEFNIGTEHYLSTEEEYSIPPFGIVEKMDLE